MPNQYSEHSTAVFARMCAYPKVILMAFWGGALLVGRVVLGDVIEQFRTDVESHASNWATTQVASPTGKKLAAWLARIAVTYPTATVLALFCAVIVFLFTISLLQVHFQHREPSLHAEPWEAKNRQHESDNVGIPSVEDAQRTAFTTYLWDVARLDSRDMWRRIHADWRAVTVDPHLDAKTPYVDLRVDFVNATVFNVSADHVEGWINYHTDPLPAPKIVAQGGGSHAEHFYVTLRQWLLPETAREMSKELPLTLKTGQLALCFRYDDETGDSKLLRYAYPDEIFTLKSNV